MSKPASRAPARGLALLSAALLAGCAAQGFRTEDARWTEDEQTLKPVWMDFTFEDAIFSSPQDGWIVGHPYILRIAGGQPQVTFLRPESSIWLYAVAAAGPSEVWVGGLADDQAAMWKFSGEWQRVPLPADSGGRVVDLEFADERNGYAISIVEERRGDRPPDARTVLLRYENGRWSVAVPPWAESRDVLLGDLCLREGTGWIVGVERVSAGSTERHASTRRPFVARLANGTWHEVETPEIAGRPFSFHPAVCGPRGELYTVARFGIRPHVGGPPPAVLRYRDGEWARIDDGLSLPPEPSDVTVAPTTGGAVWIASCDYDRNRVYVGSEGHWRPLPVPAVENGRTGGFCISGVYPFGDRAWAIANDGGGPGLYRGLLLEYTGERWRNRNWSWSRWVDLLGRLGGH